MQRPADRRITLSTGEWDIKFVRRGHPKVPRAFGYCYWDEKAIYIRYDVSPKTLIDTVLHELFHASNEILFEAEQFVTEFATVGAKTVVDILDEIHGHRPPARSPSRPRKARQPNNGRQVPRD